MKVEAKYTLRFSRAANIFIINSSYLKGAHNFNKKIYLLKSKENNNVKEH